MSSLPLPHIVVRGMPCKNPTARLRLLDLKVGEIFNTKEDDVVRLANSLSRTTKLRGTTFSVRKNRIDESWNIKCERFYRKNPIPAYQPAPAMFDVPNPESDVDKSVTADQRAEEFKANLRRRSSAAVSAPKVEPPAVTADEQQSIIDSLKAATEHIKAANKLLIKGSMSVQLMVLPLT